MNNGAKCPMCGCSPCCCSNCPVCGYTPCCCNVSQAAAGAEGKAKKNKGGM